MLQTRKKQSRMKGPALWELGSSRHWPIADSTNGRYFVSDYYRGYWTSLTICGFSAHTEGSLQDFIWRRVLWPRECAPSKVPAEGSPRQPSPALPLPACHSIPGLPMMGLPGPLLGRGVSACWGTNPFDGWKWKASNLLLREASKFSKLNSNFQGWEKDPLIFLGPRLGTPFLACRLPHMNERS